MHNPKHGEEGHDCPAERIIEWRCTAKELADYRQGLWAMAERLVIMHLAAQMAGDFEAVLEFQEIHQDVVQEWDRLDGWYKEFKATALREEADELIWQEFNVKSD